MALSNRERLTKALDLFTEAYREWVSQQLRGKHGDAGLAKAQEYLQQAARPGHTVPAGPKQWDVQALLNLVLGMWGELFRKSFGKAEKSWLHELQTIRNDWAHQKASSLGGDWSVSSKRKDCAGTEVVPCLARIAWCCCHHA